MRQYLIFRLISMAVNTTTEMFRKDFHEYVCRQANSLDPVGEKENIWPQEIKKKKTH